MIDRISQPPFCDEAEMHFISRNEVPEGLVERAAAYLNIRAEADLDAMRRNYLGEYEDEASWAAAVLADLFAPSKSDTVFEQRRKHYIERYFDYAAFARDEELNGNVVYYHEGTVVHVFAKI
jgi:antirestriction protein